ncbi:MAG TPA: MFS transporter [Nitrospiraceae bacterium]|nr:MFS transporter [Nitrospiraceae bacterium]
MTIQRRPNTGRTALLLSLLFLISVVTYIDRVNISVTARQMMPAFGLTDQEIGHVFSAFVLGYALCQIPGGRLGDRWGARMVLTAALIWWSVFTGLTALAATSPLAGVLGITGSLLFVRFMLGVGEAVALPNFNRAVADWVPSHRRGLGIGIAIGGIGVGAAITPPLAAWIMVNWGWQVVFYLCAALGLLVAIVWMYAAGSRHLDPASCPDEPSDSVSKAPASRPPVPWKQFSSHGTLRWLVLSYSCLGYVAYVYMSWFYLYLVNVRGFDVLRGGWFASAPFLAILVFCPFGGWITDRAALRWGVKRGRLLVGMTGMLLAGAAIALGSFAVSPTLAIIALSLGAGWLYFTVGAYWTSATDLSKAHTGTLSGIMNTGANLGGAISPSLTPWIADYWGWPAALGAAALVAIAGGVMWLKVDPEQAFDQ